MTEERILGKFFRPRRERPWPGTESALGAKTGAPLGNTPRQYLARRSQALEGHIEPSHGIPRAPMMIGL
jgi:hypothetical protein